MWSSTWLLWLEMKQKAFLPFSPGTRALGETEYPRKRLSRSWRAGGGMRQALGRAGRQQSPWTGMGGTTAPKSYAKAPLTSLGSSRMAQACEFLSVGHGERLQEQAGLAGGSPSPALPWNAAVWAQQGALSCWIDVFNQLCLTAMGWNGWKTGREASFCCKTSWNRFEISPDLYLWI